MSMHKTMILPVCLGILLVGIVTIPNTFAGDGCGPGTVLIDGVCELAPTPETSGGCGPGTMMVDGVCELDEENVSPSMSIEPLYIIIAVVAIGGIIGAIAVARRGSKTSKPAKQDLEEYEKQYLAGQNIEPSPKPAKKKETSPSCNNCGKPLKPEAKFCGQCGTPRS